MPVRTQLQLHRLRARNACTRWRVGEQQGIRCAVRTETVNVHISARGQVLVLEHLAAHAVVILVQLVGLHNPRIRTRAGTQAGAQHALWCGKQRASNERCKRPHARRDRTSPSGSYTSLSGLPSSLRVLAMHSSRRSPTLMGNTSDAVSTMSSTRDNSPAPTWRSTRSKRLPSGLDAVMGNTSSNKSPDASILSQRTHS